LIDSNTAVTKWAGEHMDYGMAVDGLIKQTSVKQTSMNSK